MDGWRERESHRQAVRAAPDVAPPPPAPHGEGGPALVAEDVAPIAAKLADAEWERLKALRERPAEPPPRREWMALVRGWLAETAGRPIPPVERLFDPPGPGPSGQGG